MNVMDMEPDILSDEDISHLESILGQRQENWFKNIYIYITEKCQLHCKHCYLGERLKRAATMPIDQIYHNLDIWRALGGSKLCILGGEPTLHPQFEDVVRYAIDIGYKKVTMDTNGLQTALKKISLFESSDFAFIRVSLDGASPETHEKMRGKNTFKTVVNTVEELCNKGFDIRLICTVNKINREDCLNILPLADDLGVNVVKYHIFSGVGNGKDIDQWVLTPYEWVDFTKSLLEQKGKYKTQIVYQTAYANEELGHWYHEEKYRGCIGKDLDRVSIFPDNKVYVCCYLFDTDLNFAHMGDGRVHIKKEFNELNLFMEDDGGHCKFDTLCCGGCPGEKIVRGSLPCRTYPDTFPVCRLWKTEVQ
jgi:MoaA/NifB/PqqE/SkfB family radical SAM enzyme